VMTISVPRVWNCSQRSLDSRTTLGSSASSYRMAANVLEKKYSDRNFGELQYECRI
jgi:hypothetical protein